MTRDRIEQGYFNWLCNIVCGERYSTAISYRMLLERLHTTPFRYSIPRDRDRADAGTDLRWKYVQCEMHHDRYDEALRYLDGPCSVFEMMVALAMHCDEHIMDDPLIGERTGQWFWGMIRNLGLGSMNDRSFDVEYVDERIDIFLDREYEPDGRGGLFYIRGCDRDLRDVEIFYQLCWYLNTII